MVRRSSLFFCSLPVKKKKKGEFVEKGKKVSLFEWEERKRSARDKWEKRKKRRKEFLPSTIVFLVSKNYFMTRHTWVLFCGQLLLLAGLLWTVPCAALGQAFPAVPFRPQFRVKPFLDVVPLLPYNVVDGATISLEFGYDAGKDKLSFNYQGAFNIEGTFSSVTGVLSLVGSATVSEYLGAISTVVFVTTSESTATRRITWTLGKNTFYSTLSGHYYEIRNHPLIAWQDAVISCNASSFMGLKGYLATITTTGEMLAVGQRSTAAAWLGGTDAEIEGKWLWAAGPEAGTPFWSGRSMYEYGKAPDAVPPLYSAWNRFQPDNGNGNNQDFLAIVSSRYKTRRTGTTSQMAKASIFTCANTAAWTR